MNRIVDSFNPGIAVTGPNGQLAHPAHLAHSKRLELKMYQVGDKAWSYVGNGLSNQSFVEGPGGLIAIDTGECAEEMAAALVALRKITKTPIVACIYSHFHYVGGTAAIVEESGNDDLDIYGHSGIPANKARFGGEVGPRGGRGMVHQFAMMLPLDGPDASVNLGIGRFYRNPEHAPFTSGYIEASHTFDKPTTFQIAGLEVQMLPAPSDASDSITIWFPSLKLAVNNLLWPALFNVFAIRGEEYRDPRVLLTGLDELGGLEADYLLGAHGPPVEGADFIETSITGYRDAIQYIWDQTVRGTNKGLTLDELTTFVQLPDRFRDQYFTAQLYGLVEHHVRQIHNGLFGWFDEDEAKLFPTPAPERAQKLIAGFGGKEKVRLAVDEALAQEDYRWAIELSTWLVRCALDDDGRAEGGEQEDKKRLGQALRLVAQSTTSANARNWCLTRALELEGIIDLERLRRHRFRAIDVLANPAADTVPVLRVLLSPEKAVDIDEELGFRFDDGTAAGLYIRHQVAVPTDGKNAINVLTISHKDWAAVLGGKVSLVELMSSGQAEAAPDADSCLRLLKCFDVAGFQSS